MCVIVAQCHVNDCKETPPFTRPRHAFTSVSLSFRQRRSGNPRSLNSIDVGVQTSDEENPEPIILQSIIS